MTNDIETWRKVFMHLYKPKKKVKKELTRRKKSDIIIKLSGTAERSKLKNKRREPGKVRGRSSKPSLKDSDKQSKYYLAT